MKRNAYVLALLLVCAAAGAAERLNVIFNAGTSDAEKDRAVLRSGASKIGDLSAFNAVTVSAGNAAARAGLLANASVARVETDAVVYTIDVSQAASSRAAPARGGSNPPQVTPTGISRIGATPPAAPDNSAGAGVLVAIIDTGIMLTHPDLQANIVGGVNFVNTRKSADDDNGHGTHCAGTVAAVNNSIGVVGVAPGAKLLAVKVLDRNGSGYVSTVAAGVDWAVTNGAQVISMSLGSTSDVDLLHIAVDSAALAGIQIACAAGNDGPGVDTVNYPAKYSACIAVSAWVDTDGQRGGLGSATGYGADDTLATFSSTGPLVAITAPGVNILSCWNNGGYNTISGTSMATPHVAGALARLAAAHSGNPRAALLAGTESVNLVNPDGTITILWSSEQVGSGLLHTP